MAVGQAERLFPMLGEMLAEQGLAWRDLDAIGVGTGPGNFTGVRIAVSAARGLALGLGVPAFGVSTFEVVASIDDGCGDTGVVSIPAPRGALYVCQVRHGRLDGKPVLYDPQHPNGDVVSGPCCIIGERVHEIASGHAAVFCEREVPAGADAIARAAIRRLAAGERPPRPAPLYVRPADAAPPSDLPPVILP